MAFVHMYIWVHLLGFDSPSWVSFLENNFSLSEQLTKSYKLLVKIGLFGFSTFILGCQIGLLLRLSHLGDHAAMTSLVQLLVKYSRQSNNGLLGPLVPITFLCILPGYFLSLRSRVCLVDMSVIAVHPLSIVLCTMTSCGFL